MAGAISADTVCLDSVLRRVDTTFEEEKDVVAAHPTARLRLQYMNIIDILRQFTKGERTSNWCLHLQSFHEMLPYFTATGHI